MLQIAYSIVSILILYFSSNFLEKFQEPQEIIQKHETLYLPNGTFLKGLSLGYENVLADILWFQTINYFGKHLKSDRSYEWLSHMCDLVTTLSPKSIHVYKFGATMLAWEANDYQKAQLLLDKSIKDNPKDWFLVYVRGFNYMHFLKDPEKAHADFVKSASLPGAHPIVIGLAARSISEIGSDEVAIETMNQMLATTKDPLTVENIKKEINRLQSGIYRKMIENPKKKDEDKEKK